MRNHLLIFISWACLVSANDFLVGHVDQFSRKIFSEIKESRIFSGSEDFEVSATGNEVITGISILDLTKDKHGEAYVQGGIGSREIRVHLSRPGFFSGYKFKVDIYATDVNSRYENSRFGLPTRAYDSEDLQYARKN